MTDDQGTAATLRRAFDESFASAPAAGHDQVESFLGLGINGAPFAIAMREIAGIVTDRNVIPLPASVDSFLGLTTHRGVLVPIYDLGVLLGHGSSKPIWIALARARDALVGFGFDRFDGHFRVAGDATNNPDLLSFVAGLPDTRPVINLTLLIESILRQTAAVNRKEL